MRALALIFVLALGASAAEPGFVSLFDGKSLQGWNFVAKKGSGYQVEGARLVCPADGGGNLFTEKEYANFVLRFEFKLEDGSNNGVGIRSPLTGDAAYEGMEIQILDDAAPVYRGKLKPAQYHGSIYDVAPAKQGFRKPNGEWNSEEITADGRRIRVVLNGTTIVDADLDTITDPAVLAKHPGLKRAKGHIGFLGHGTRVEFRNIRIKELP
ncbi:MAG: DUF1080 domain-containing protein [Acidobacteria bacterium]|nr:DUF1080 domain-containing protein [Acidobacteriota bacterium]